MRGGNRGNYPLQGRGFPIFFALKELILENFLRLRRLSAPQAHIFAQILVNFDKKAALMSTFFVTNTKIFARAFGAPMFCYLYVKITPPRKRLKNRPWSGARQAFSKTFFEFKTRKKEKKNALNLIFPELAPSNIKIIQKFSYKDPPPQTKIPA